MNVLDFVTKKTNKEKISMVTAYDYWTAKICSETSIDCLLVGDSVAVVMHGYPTTVSADIQMMEFHTKMVSRGAPKSFIIADMPFLTVRKDLSFAMDAVQKLMQAGASAVKIEGLKGHETIISHIIQSGIPVMGHLGLTPQSFYAFGGNKVQAKDDSAQIELLTQAKELEKLGCFAIVLECVPSKIAEKVSISLKIPVIGIGAGANVDGQVLVFHDLLGVDSSFKPKFVRHFLSGETLIKNALNNYAQEVKIGTFPNESEQYVL